MSGRDCPFFPFENLSVWRAELAQLLPRSPFSTLTSVPGWGVVRVANYAAALGDPIEGSVALRLALIEIGVGLWLTESTAKTYAQGLSARGRRGGVIACALAHRTTRIAHAPVRDHTGYDPYRWT